MKNSLSQTSKLVETLQAEASALQEQNKHLKAENKTLQQRQQLARKSADSEIEAYKQLRFTEVDDEIKPLLKSKESLTSEVDELSLRKEQLQKDIEKESKALALVLSDIESAGKALADVLEKVPLAEEN